MLKSKRKSFVKQLWRCRVVERETALEESLYAACKAFFKTIKRTRDIEELRDLIGAARAPHDGSPGACFLVGADELDTSAGKFLPEVLACKLWRWADLPANAQLKNIPDCARRTRKHDDGRVCANPFHYGRVDRGDDVDSRDATTTAPAAPRSDLVRVPGSFRAKNESTCSTTFEESESIATKTLSDYLDNHTSHWCTISYWELMHRVGRQYNATSDAVDVFADYPHGNGLCVQPLVHEKRPDAVKRVREHIGKGIQFSFEDDGIWAYNRSDYPVFVQSPTIDFTSRGSTAAKLPAVRRLSPGYSIRVFDFDVCREMLLFGGEKLPPRSGQIPDDPFAFRVSFAKGWGPSYTRPNISACPCWLEVFLNVQR